MSVEVYIWSHSRTDSWGHSSVWVKPNGPYISWWPSFNTAAREYLVDKNKHKTLAKIVQKFIGTTNIYKVKHRCAASYIEDLQAEGRNPQYKAVIEDDVLDEDAIRLWWTGYNYTTASYHSIKKNCCTTVIRALRAGGSDRYAKLAHDFFSKQTGWEPTDIYDYLRRMRRGIGEDRMKIEQNPSFVAESVGSAGGEESGGAMCPRHPGYTLLECPNC